ncbi:hypothetical protein EVAR_8366_1 [Eumeta japonica]|uniref:Uncharacterized protein n=1 Tax=Eumeta variegata TaxID=151549 RepID=A0A4C1VE44_EUMVA|nr:hypothetical protein EVAR_8366_1 [Eumeta japonica]
MGLRLKSDVSGNRVKSRIVAVRIAATLVFMLIPSLAPDGGPAINGYSLDGAERFHWMALVSRRRRRRPAVVLRSGAPGFRNGRLRRRIRRPLTN